MGHTFSMPFFIGWLRYFPVQHIPCKKISSWGLFTKERSKDVFSLHNTIGFKSSLGCSKSSIPVTWRTVMCRDSTALFKFIQVHAAYLTWIISLNISLHSWWTDTDPISRIFLGNSRLELLAHIALHDLERHWHVQFGNAVSLSKPWHLTFFLGFGFYYLASWTVSSLFSSTTQTMRRNDTLILGQATQVSMTFIRK